MVEACMVLRNQTVTLHLHIYLHSLWLVCAYNYYIFSLLRLIICNDIQSSQYTKINLLFYYESAAPVARGGKME